MNWLVLVALFAGGSLLLMVLFVGLSLGTRVTKSHRKPLRDIDLPQSSDAIDPWVESGRRHSDDD